MRLARSSRFHCPMLLKRDFYHNGSDILRLIVRFPCNPPVCKNKIFELGLIKSLVIWL